MTLKHMRIFAEVCKYSSITLAGKSLGLSQPSVSAIIKDIENEYGIKLFDRMSNRLYITPEGQQMYDLVMEILMKSEELARIKPVTEGCRSIRIGADASFGVMPLPVILKEVREEHPEIKVSVHLYAPDVLEQMLLSNELDLVFSLPLRSDQLNQDLSLRDGMVLVCGESLYNKYQGRLTLKDLEGEEIACMDTGVPQFDVVKRRLMERIPGARVTVTSDSTLAIMCVVEEGMGLVAIPSGMATHALSHFPKLRKLDVEDLNLCSRFYCITHKQKHLDSSIKIIKKKAEDVCHSLYDINDAQ